MLSEKPKICITASVAMSETGIAIVGMIVARQLCRKTKTTRTTRQKRLDQRDHDVVHRRRHEARRVIVHRVGDSRREALRELLHLRFDLPLQVERVGARHLEDRQHDRRVLAEKGGRRILQRAEFDARDVAQAHHGAARRIGADDDIGEFLRIGEPPLGVDLQFERGPGRRRRLADLAGGDLNVLLGDGVLDVDGGHAEIGELVRIEPDAHRIAALAEHLDVADAWQPLQLVEDLQIGVIRQRHRIDRTVRRDQIDDENEVRILLLDRHAALIDDRRKRGGRLRHPVLHVDRGDVERVADLEGDGDRRGAVIRARRGHVGHALDAVDLLLERSRHRVGDDLRACARVVGADDDLRRRNLRELRDRQQKKADGAGEHEDRGDRRGEDRTLDEEADHGIASASPEQGQQQRDAPHSPPVARGVGRIRSSGPRNEPRRPRSARPARSRRTPRLGDAAGSPVQQRLQRLRLDAVGVHDRLDQRIRQKVVDCLGVRYAMAVFLSTKASGVLPAAV